MVTAPRPALPGWGPLRLALLDALTAGAGLGYLAHQYREALVANSAAIGLGLLLVLALGYVVRKGVRALRRANSRVEDILAEELPKKPSPGPR